jgi:hypothetical protein
MKKIIISLILLGTTNLNFAQGTNYELDMPVFTFPNEVNTKRMDSNYEYLTQVQNSTTPTQVKNLENNILDWNVKNTKAFKGRKAEIFKVKFESIKGQIIASYDSNGEILATEEHFYNVTLPKEVVLSILREHPGWRLYESKYSLMYNKKTGVKKTFKVLIQKNNKKIWLNIDSLGNMS